MMHPATKRAIARRLNAAADILETRGWTRGFYARDASGEDVDEWSPAAVSFCALGALRRAVSEIDGIPVEEFLDEPKGPFYEPAYEALADEIRLKNGGTIVEYNDERVRNRVPIVKAFRRAAERVLA